MPDQVLRLLDAFLHGIKTEEVPALLEKKIKTRLWRKAIGQKTPPGRENFKHAQVQIAVQAAIQRDSGSGIQVRARLLPALPRQQWKRLATSQFSQQMGPAWVAFSHCSKKAQLFASVRRQGPANILNKTGNPGHIVKTGLNEPVRVLSRKTAQDKIKSGPLCIIDQIANGRILLMDVGDTQDLGTIKRAEIQRLVRSIEMCADYNRIIFGRKVQQFEDG